MAFHPVDVYVGTRIRQRRLLLGVSQAALGDAVGITFQQVQKYERGSNRISASRLVEFAKLLDVPAAYFFDELPPKAVTAKIDRKGKMALEIGSVLGGDLDPMVRRESLELIRGYYRIREPRVRKQLLGIVNALSGANEQ